MAFGSRKKVLPRHPASREVSDLVAGRVKAIIGNNLANPVGRRKGSPGRLCGREPAFLLVRKRIHRYSGIPCELLRRLLPVCRRGPSLRRPKRPGWVSYPPTAVFKSSGASPWRGWPAWAGRLLR